MKLAVVTTRMSAVNTFLERDLRGLLARGVSVDLWLVHPEGLPPALADAITRHAGSVRTIPKPWAPVALAALAREALRAPKRVTGSVAIALACVVKSPTEGLLALGAITSALAMAAQLSTTGANRVHALWAGTPAILAYWIRRHAGVPYGFSAHAWDIQRRTSLLGRKIEDATGVVVCSRHAFERLRSMASPGARDKIRLVHHGLDLASWRPTPGARRSEPPLILAVGRLTPKKGFEDLVRACAHLVAEGRSFRCEIVGPEWRSGHQIRALIEALGLSGHVRAVGALPLDEVRRRMEAATVFASPSITTDSGESDGIPNVVLEAMSLEIPVVATDAGGLLEVVHDRKTGRIVPQRDPERLAKVIGEVLSDPEGSRNMARAGRIEVEASFDILTTAKQLSEAIGIDMVTERT